MKTKLVYVLTCSPEGTYIEQALMSIWSARYHNQDAWIVLITDDRTNQLLVGKRGELLKYISERIVIPFEDDSLSMMYRSRWIKTQVRRFIEGPFLFIDCDTVCCGSLAKIDTFDCEVAAEDDDNVLFQLNVFKDSTTTVVAKLECDISQEEHYFSSGVLFCKDTPRVHRLYSLWHSYWKDAVRNNGVSIDQPSLAKANIESGHLIQPMPSVYNCVLYTQNSELRNAIILHVNLFDQTSFLFKKNALEIIKRDGIVPWLSYCLTNIHITYLPFDNEIQRSTYKQRLEWIRGIAKAAKLYKRNVKSTFEEWSFRIGPESIVNLLFGLGLYFLGGFIWLEWRYNVVKNKELRSNICAIQ